MWLGVEIHNPPINAQGKKIVAPLPLAGQSPLPPAHHGEVEVGF